MKSLRQQWREQSRHELERAVAWAGSPATLARVLGVTPQVVWNWQQRGRISIEGAEALEARGEGQFRKSTLRPDIIEWWSVNET